MTHAGLGDVVADAEKEMATILKDGVAQDIKAQLEEHLREAKLNREREATHPL